jgi:HlyD family secretion protein
VPLALLGFAGAGAAAGLGVFAPDLFTKKRQDLLLHTVKLEPLPIAVVEKGTLESADNRDIVCRVKAGAKGTYASTIRWVIDDGSIVTKGTLLIELDDSALQEQYKDQAIVVEKARAEFIAADQNYAITVQQNASDIAAAEAALQVAELELDMFVGYRAEPGLNMFGAVIGIPATLVEKGDFKRQLDEASANLKQAESELEATRDRAGWAARSVKLGYLTPAQANVEITKYESARDKVEQLSKAKYILENFTRQRDLTQRKADLEVARIGLETALLQAKSKEVQAASDRKTKLSVLQQEQEKLRDIENQIAECKIRAPQDGMVVYYKESSRWSSNSQEGMIQQGAQVKEGQKLMRLPDLRKMQVNTKVHEALVSRIRGDDRRPTGFVEMLRAGLLVNPDPFTRLVSQSDTSIEMLREMYRDREFTIAEQGMPATIRVDAFPNRVFTGRVRSVAAVANQQDWMSSDVKVYQTLVLIDGTVDGLKPDMNAEVTIHVDHSGEPVLAVPIQAVVGGAEAGPQRIVYVMTPTGPQPREVTLGRFNDKMIEVISGVEEGDQVVLNPKAIIGDAAKTREPGDGTRSRGGMPGGDGGKSGEKKGKGSMPPGMPGGPPGGGPPRGGPQA